MDSLTLLGICKFLFMCRSFSHINREHLAIKKKKTAENFSGEYLVGSISYEIQCHAFSPEMVPPHLGFFPGSLLQWLSMWDLWHPFHIQQNNWNLWQSKKQEISESLQLGMVVQNPTLRGGEAGKSQAQGQSGSHQWRAKLKYME